MPGLEYMTIFCRQQSPFVGTTPPSAACHRLPTTPLLRYAVPQDLREEPT